MDSKPGRSDHRPGARVVDANNRPWWPWPMVGAVRIGRRWAAWWSWPQRFVDPRQKLWSGLLTAAVVLALLLAFHQVVLGGMRQGEVRRQEAAALADATWRCQALRGAERARQCLDRLTDPNQARGEVRPAGTSRRLSLGDSAAAAIGKEE